MPYGPLGRTRSTRCFPDTSMGASFYAAFSGDCRLSKAPCEETEEAGSDLRLGSRCMELLNIGLNRPRFTELHRASLAIENDRCAATTAARSIHAGLDCARRSRLGFRACCVERLVLTNRFRVKEADPPWLGVETREFILILRSETAHRSRPRSDKGRAPVRA